MVEVGPVMIFVVVLMTDGVSKLVYRFQKCTGLLWYLRTINQNTAGYCCRVTVLRAAGLRLRFGSANGR